MFGAGGKKGGKEGRREGKKYRCFQWVRWEKKCIGRKISGKRQEEKKEIQ